jgi:hypothetical protein
MYSAYPNVRVLPDLRVLLSVLALRHHDGCYAYVVLSTTPLDPFQVNTVRRRNFASRHFHKPTASPSIVPSEARNSLPGSIRSWLFRVLYRWRMSTSDAPLSSTIPASTLDEAALGFVAPPKFSRQLESKRNAVLTLRAKYASYPQIQDLLKAYGIEVPESAIARFCRKYRGQIQRLRINLEQETAVPADLPVPKPTTFIPTVSPTPNPIASPSRKLRDLRGPV